MAVSSWTANASGSWRNTWGWRTDNNNVYQGDWAGNGLHRGFWFFNDSNIRSTLSGRTITNIRLRITRVNAGGNFGNVTGYVRMHNYASQPSGTPSTNTSAQTHQSWARGDTKWITVPIWWGEWLRDNNSKGIGLYTSSTSNDRYAIFTPTCIIEITHEPTIVAPPTPSGFNVTSTTVNSATMSWNSVSTADNYRVDREGGGTSTTTSTSFTNGGLASNTRDRWRVRAQNSAGVSSYTGWVAHVTNPTTPTGLNITGTTAGSVSMAWNAVPGPDLQRYRFQRRTGTSGNPSYEWTWTPRTSGTNTGQVAPNTTYQYRVRAENAGGVSSYSGYVTALTVPAAPTNLNAVSSHNSVTLTWSGSGTYRVRRDGVTIANGISDTSYTDTNRSPLTSYTYAVQAYNNSGDSPWSANRTATTASSKVIRIKSMPTDEPAMIFPNGVAEALNGEMSTIFRITDSLTLSGGNENANLPYVLGIRGEPSGVGVDGVAIMVKKAGTPKRFFLTGLDEADMQISASNIVLNTWYRARLRVVGRQVSAKVWPVGATEPDWTSGIGDVREPGFAYIGCAGTPAGGTSTDSRYEWDTFQLENLTGAFNIDLLGDLFIGGPTFDDARFRVAADGTLSIGGDTAETAPFQVSQTGALTTGASVFTGTVNMSNNRITNLLGPTSANHAATRGYVDDLFASPGAHLRKTSDQTNVPHNTITQVTWQTSDYNANGAADLSNNRIVATRSGIYIASASINASNDGNITRLDIALRVNGGFRATQPVIIGDLSVSSVATRASVSLIHRMNQGDYFDLVFRHWSEGGGTQQINAVTYTHLAAQWLRPW